MTVYEPNAGDVIWTDFEPRTGREQGGRRPALVVSPVAFWRSYGFAVVCPITSKIRPFPPSVVLPDNLTLKGEILTHHFRSIDTEARPIAFTGDCVTEDILSEVRAKMAAIIGMDDW